jgi:hypothetical protein
LKYFILPAAILSLSAVPAVANCVSIGDAPFFLAEGGPPVPLEPAFEDYSYMLYDTCDAIALEDCSYLTLMGEIGFNAVATLCPPDWGAIIYDRRLSGIVGSEGAETIIAHELGHLQCGHLKTIDETAEQAQAEELEADAFAGAAMRMRGFQRDALRAVLPVLSEQPSLSHPARAERLLALQKGYDDPEGNLCR